MASLARMSTTLSVVLILTSVVPGQCRRSVSNDDVDPRLVVDANKVMIPVADGKLALNSKVFKCCIHSQTGDVTLQDMSNDLPKARNFCWDNEGCGCMFGDHFHSYTYSWPSCAVRLSHLSQATGESVANLWSMWARLWNLPPALNACQGDTRPEGIHTQNMYCTQDQGFACEVWNFDGLKGFGFKLHVAVWSSYGCGCDAKSFRAGSWTTKKRPNGPRIWTADTFVSGDEPTPGSLDETGKYVTEVFDGITYKYGAELYVPYSTIIKEPFILSNISRAGKQIWRKGRQVYEISVGDDTFVMQAISQQVDPMLTDNSGLKGLLSRKLPGMDTFWNTVKGGGSPMSLPQGMTYQCRVLAEDLLLESHGAAVIMQDHFYNNYMLDNVKAKYSGEECVEETEQWRLDYCGKALSKPRPGGRRG